MDAYSNVARKNKNKKPKPTRTGITLHSVAFELLIFVSWLMCLVYSYRAEGWRGERFLYSLSFSSSLIIFITFPTFELHPTPLSFLASAAPGGVCNESARVTTDSNKSPVSLSIVDSLSVERERES